MKYSHVGSSARIGAALRTMFLSILMASAAVSTADRSGQEFGAAFEQVLKVTRNSFYDKQMHGLDWTAIGDKYRTSVQSSHTRFDFELAVNRMLNELKASHLGYFTPDDLEYYMLPAVFRGEMDSPKIAHIGVTGERSAGGFLVRAVLDGSPALKAGIQAGDNLLDAGGEPFSPVGSFIGRAGSSLLVAGERPGVGRSTFVVKPVLESPQRSFLAATRKSIKVIERSGKRIGYIHLWCMTHDSFRQVLDEAVTGDLARADGLILDLRDGFGGHPFGYSDVLMRPDVEWEEDRRGERSTKHTGYSKPVVALINGGTRSAKEFLSYQLKKSGRAILVGTRTAGAFLGATGVAIGSEGFLEVPATGLKVDGAKLEGRGVEPDIQVQPQGTYGANDSQLNKGLEVLLTRISANMK